MSVISSLSKAHKIHYFYFNQPADLNASVTRGYVEKLYSLASDRPTGNVIVNGFTNYIDFTEINQVNFSLILDNGSLSLNTQFHFTRDSIGKITFPPKILTRDGNGRMIMMTLHQMDSGLKKIQVGVQIV
jgi:hypothetical protein